MHRFALQPLRKVLRRARALPGSLRHRFELRAFRQAVLDGRSIRVGTEGEIEVRTFFGRRTLLEGIAALKSFYRFAPECFPLVVHEDGTFTRDDATLLTAHLPGVRIVDRETADREVNGYLEAQGLVRCAALRRGFVLAVKYFDVPFYGRGRRLLYLDSDVLFLQPPDALFEVLATRPSGAAGRHRPPDVPLVG